MRFWDAQPRGVYLERDAGRDSTTLEPQKLVCGQRSKQWELATLVVLQKKDAGNGINSIACIGQCAPALVYGSTMSALAVVRLARALLASVILPLAFEASPALIALPRALLNSFCALRCK